MIRSFRHLSFSSWLSRRSRFNREPDRKSLLVTETPDERIERKKLEKQMQLKVRRNRFKDGQPDIKPHESVVLFSSSRAHYPEIGRPFFNNERYKPILDMANAIYKGYVFKQHESFRSVFYGVPSTLCILRS